MAKATPCRVPLLPPLVGSELAVEPNQRVDEVTSNGTCAEDLREPGEAAQPVGVPEVRTRTARLN